MQAVAFEVADHLAVEVDLVQVAAAVVPAIEPAAIGSYRLAYYQVWPGIQNRLLPPDLMIFSTSSVNDFAISVLSSAVG